MHVKREHRAIVAARYDEVIIFALKKLQYRCAPGSWIVGIARQAMDDIDVFRFQCGRAPIERNRMNFFSRTPKRARDGQEDPRIVAKKENALFVLFSHRFLFKIAERQAATLDPAQLSKRSLSARENAH